MGLAAPQQVGSSRTSDGIRDPGIGRQILSHWTTREVPQQVFYLLYFKVCGQQGDPTSPS